MAKVLLLAALAVACALGSVAIVAVVIVAVIALVAVGGASDRSTQPGKFLDVRSDYNRRVWAAEHNYEADGDDSHNYEADGDRPW